MSSTKKFSSSNILNRFAFIFVRIYQATFSQFFGGRCRYYPSCSHYAVQAYENFTFLRATQLVFLRFISCHPLSKKPFYDPVPFIERNSYE
ncbi:MAG: membrane protein insertion efficiency factor YidD [Bdellovibrio sp.]|nr:membrane protein insertion efficiency factor YidD [Bdellovibrio sp.]